MHARGLQQVHGDIDGGHTLFWFIHARGLQCDRASQRFVDYIFRFMHARGLQRGCLSVAGGLPCYLFQFMHARGLQLTLERLRTRHFNSCMLEDCDVEVLALFCGGSDFDSCMCEDCDLIPNPPYPCGWHFNSCMREDCNCYFVQIFPLTAVISIHACARIVAGSG